MATRSPLPRQVFGEIATGLPGVIMLGRYRHSASQTGLKPHSHRDAIEICFLERGEQTYRVGGVLYRLRGNDLFFTLPGEIHDTANLPQERGILYWLILMLEPRRKFLGLAEPLASRLKRELRRMPTRHFRGHPTCTVLLGEMVDLLSQRKPAKEGALRQLRLQSLLLQFLTLTLEASHRGAHGSASPLIYRVIQYIEKHLDEPVHVPRLAEIARLSESRFKARFKREMGVPPAEFWLRQKIARASVLLKTRNVTEVAHELGFSSSQYFATVFKRYTLSSPSRFKTKSKG